MVKKPSTKRHNATSGIAYQKTKIAAVDKTKNSSATSPAAMTTIRKIAPIIREIKFQPKTCRKRFKSKPRPYPVISLCQGENSRGAKKPMEKYFHAQRMKFLPIVKIFRGATAKNQRKKEIIRLLPTC